MKTLLWSCYKVVIGHYGYDDLDILEIDMTWWKFEINNDIWLANSMVNNEHTLICMMIRLSNEASKIVIKCP